MNEVTGLHWNIPGCVSRMLYPYQPKGIHYPKDIPAIPPKSPEHFLGIGTDFISRSGKSLGTLGRDVEITVCLDLQAYQCR